MNMAQASKAIVSIEGLTWGKNQIQELNRILGRYGVDTFNSKHDPRVTAKMIMQKIREE